MIRNDPITGGRREPSIWATRPDTERAFAHRERTGEHSFGVFEEEVIAALNCCHEQSNDSFFERISANGGGDDGRGRN